MIDRRALTVGILLAAVAGLIAPPRSQDILAQSSQAPAPPPRFTLEGEVALWTVAIKADKSADFEKIIAKLREGLAKSENPDRRKQLAGWKVIKIDKPLPDGNLAYVHVIDPVVRGADYTVMQALYDEFPNERQTLYELYRGAFAQNLSLAVGTVVGDSTTALHVPPLGSATAIAR